MLQESKFDLDKSRIVCKDMLTLCDFQDTKLSGEYLSSPICRGAQGDMLIGTDILEKTCKGMIETILFCLSDAIKGTIYRVGRMPKLQVVRVTSGVREEGCDHIKWGLPEASDYNFPGKTWEQYRDRPNHLREAMGWCVEMQKSWTADNPYEDDRSVRKQLSGEIEDFYHMEPVLVRKSYLYGDQLSTGEYPLDWEGAPIWEHSEYVVFAVIKIHFKPYSIHRGDRSTKVIKKLSQTLGTELLSLQIRETLSDAQKELARQRMQSCNVLAHELRNTLIKLSFAFSAVNAEISFIREQWEAQVDAAFPDEESKKTTLKRLSRLITERLPKLNGALYLRQVGGELLAEQEEMARRPLMPHFSEKWIENKIRPKWCRLLSESDVWNNDKEEIQRLIASLEKAIWRGSDARVVEKIDRLPKDLRNEWARLAYVDFSADKVGVLDEILQFLQHPDLDMPHRHQTRKVLTSLKALVEVIPQVEERANRIIYSLKNGNSMSTEY